MDISCYSPEELGKQYSPSRWNRRMDPSKIVEEHSNICAAESVRTRDQWKCSSSLRYGEKPRQTLDMLWGEKTPSDAPLFVFLHGGYWMACCKEEYDLIATPIIQAGGRFISMGYDLTPTVTMTEIVEEARQAIRYIINMARQSNCKSIYLCGYCAGAQMWLMSVCSDSGEEVQSPVLDPQDRLLIKGLILISGMYDLVPLLLTPENDKLKMSRDEAWRQSPMNPHNLSAVTSQFSHCDVMTILAEYDSPQYKLQSQKYHQLLIDGGINSTFLTVPGVDHFNIVENLKDSDDALMKEILQLMKRTSN